ncbi:hypothetical protein FGB62_161g03 [Gracilaria domingensis]|nr:hypothetical protein FGB62_161g03 [Gracilaria domingensis]
MKTDLSRETAENVTVKKQKCIQRIDQKVGISTSFAFISDSCNGMRLVRKLLHGCWKTRCYFANCVESSLCFENDEERWFDSENIRIYLSGEATSGVFNAAVFTNAMDYSEPNVVTSCRSAIGTGIHSVCVVERTTAESQSFWTKVREGHSLFNPVLLFTGLLESESAKIDDAYACLIAMKIAIRGAYVISDVEENQIEMSLIRRWDRIYIPVSALAFQCDAYYFDFRNYVTIRFGAALLELNKGSLADQCHNAIEELARDEEHSQLLLADYLHFASIPGLSWPSSKTFNPDMFGDR